MSDSQQSWVRERATTFSSCDPDAPLTDEERAAMDRMVGEGGVVGIGEAIHGSGTITHALGRILRFLIGERQADVLVLEACFGATLTLDRYVARGEGDAEAALVATGSWNYANRETLTYVSWLREHNLSSRPDRPVRVFGCDCQSIDGLKAELLRLLQRFVATGVLSQAEAAETAALVAALPTDRHLGRLAKMMMHEMELKDPADSRMAEIESWQSAFVATVPANLELASRRLADILDALPSSVSDDDHFLFKRCARSLEQVVEFYSPGDAVGKRDAFMAENVLAVRRHFRPDRLLLFAHTLHVARAPWFVRGYRFEPTGSVLSRELGDDYRVIGSAFHHGRHLAFAEYRPEDDLVEDAHPPGPLAFEAVLQQIAADRQGLGLLVELGESRLRGCDSPWPDGIEMRLGETGQKGNYEDCFTSARPELQYDGMLFVSQISPITVLPGLYRHAREQWGPREDGPPAPA